MTTDNSDVNLSIPIGAVVKAWRERRGLTVTQLAEHTGRPITKGYVSELERGKIRQPGDDHLVLLSRALEIPVLYLVSRRLPDDEQAEQLATNQGNEEVAETRQRQRELASEGNLEDFAPNESLAFPSLLERGFLSTSRSRAAQRDRFFSTLAQLLDQSEFPANIESLVQELILGSAEGICERMERQLNDG